MTDQEIERRCKQILMAPGSAQDPTEGACEALVGEGASRHDVVPIMARLLRESAEAPPPVPPVAPSRVASPLADDEALS